MIILTVAAGLAGGYEVTSRTPVYETHTTIYVGYRQLSQPGVLSGDLSVGLDRIAATFADMIKSRPIAEKALASSQVPRTADDVVGETKASLVANTDLIQVSVTDVNPNVAQTLANGISQTFVTEVQNFEPGTPAGPGSLPQLPAYVFEPAAFPSSPLSSGLTRNLILGGLLGLILSVSVALLLEYLDDSIKGRDDIERLTPGLPVLGTIPSITVRRKDIRTAVVAQRDSGAEATEAYRALRTSIHFLALDRPIRTIQVTSPNAGEGKTTTVANLGVVFARAGQRVVIASCDLRAPRIHEFLGLSNHVGFTSVLLGDVPLSAALQDVFGDERLQLLASGPVPPNPSELLSGHRTVEVLTALQSEADIVLIDAPPVLPVTDAAVLSARADALLLVADVRRTTRRALRRAIETLRQVDAPVAGVVLNRVSDESSYSYRYGYQEAAPAEPAAVAPQPAVPANAESASN